MGFFEMVGILFYRVIGIRKSPVKNYTIETKEIGGIKVEVSKDRE